VMKDRIENYSDSDQVEFLRAAQNWPVLKGKRAANQTLGAGTNGIVPKFQYKGSGPRMSRFMVVMQSHEDEQNELELDSRHLQ